MAKTKRIFILFAAMLFLISSVASAEVVRVEGVTGQCIMGDTDTPAKAKEGAVKDAMRYAVERAGVNVMSVSEMINMQLTKDEVTTVAGGIVKVENESFRRGMEGDNIVFYATIDATVDTDLNKVEEAIRKVKVGGRVYHPTEDTSTSDNDEAITGLIIDYRPLEGPGHSILDLDTDKGQVKSEDGTVVFDASYVPNRRGDLCIRKANLTTTYQAAGAHPYCVTPVYFERHRSIDYYWTNPVLKKEDADKILRLNDKYHFLNHGKVYVIDSTVHN